MDQIVEMPEDLKVDGIEEFIEEQGIARPETMQEWRAVKDAFVTHFQDQRFERARR